jgi:DNA-binding transcriptional MerR regulator
VLARARDLIEFARQHGFSREEIIQIIESLP